MITIDKIGGQTVTKRAELYGLSTDTKPIIDGIPTGSTFYVVDTQEIYMYDEEHQIWIKQ